MTKILPLNQLQSGQPLPTLPALPCCRLVLSPPHLTPPTLVQDTNVGFMVLDRGDATITIGTYSPPFAKGQAFIVSVLDSVLSLVKCILRWFDMCMEFYPSFLMMVR